MKELEAAVWALTEATADEERVRGLVVQAHQALALANSTHLETLDRLNDAREQYAKALQGAMAEARALKYSRMAS